MIGDRLDVIGSGPAHPDPTTFVEVREILLRRGLEDRVPAAVRAVLREGLEGRRRETPKPGDPRLEGVHHRIVGSNPVATGAAARSARRRGYRTRRLREPLVGDVEAVARSVATIVRRERGEPGPVCLVAGGETTVRVRGDGLGGRNQELALRLAVELEGVDAAWLAAGTDGIDGPTTAAGGFADGTTVERARTGGPGLAESLSRNDSHRCLEALGDLLTVGPTGTNVADLLVVVVPGGRGAPPAGVPGGS